jgi:hypothetical protein
MQMPDILEYKRENPTIEIADERLRGFLQTIKTPVPETMPLMKIPACRVSTLDWLRVELQHLHGIITGTVSNAISDAARSTKHLQKINNLQKYKRHAEFIAALQDIRQAALGERAVSDGQEPPIEKDYKNAGRDRAFLMLLRRYGEKIAAENGLPFSRDFYARSYEQAYGRIPYNFEQWLDNPTPKNLGFLTMIVSRMAGAIQTTKQGKTQDVHLNTLIIGLCDIFFKLTGEKPIATSINTKTDASKHDVKGNCVAFVEQGIKILGVWGRLYRPALIADLLQRVDKGDATLRLLPSIHPSFSQ